MNSTLDYNNCLFKSEIDQTMYNILNKTSDFKHISLFSFYSYQRVIIWFCYFYLIFKFQTINKNVLILCIRIMVLCFGLSHSGDRVASRNITPLIAVCSIQMRLRTCDISTVQSKKGLFSFICFISYKLKINKLRNALIL